MRVCSRPEFIDLLYSVLFTALALAGDESVLLSPVTPEPGTSQVLSKRGAAGDQRTEPGSCREGLPSLGTLEAEAFCR